MSALDGLRGVAVAGVLLFHGGHLAGGYLGVDLFFVLSGLPHHVAAARRVGRHRHVPRSAASGPAGARRLLPALALVLLGVAVYCVRLRRARRARPDPRRRARHHRLRRQLAGDLRRARLLGALHGPSPLAAHLEPRDRGAVLPGVAARVRRARRLVEAAHPAGRARHRARPRHGRPTLLMVVLYDPADLNRAYYGTDTRAYALFAGIAVAAARGIWGHAKDPRRRVAVEVAALVGARRARVSCGSRLDGQSERLYRGGSLVAGAAALLSSRRRCNPQRGPLGWVLLVPAALLARAHQLRPLPLALARRRRGERGPHRARRLAALRAPDRVSSRSRSRRTSHRDADPARHVAHPPTTGARARRRERRRAGDDREHRRARRRPRPPAHRSRHRSDIGTSPWSATLSPTASTPDSARPASRATSGGRAAAA